MRSVNMIDLTVSFLNLPESDSDYNKLLESLDANREQLSNLGLDEMLSALHDKRHRYTVEIPVSNADCSNYVSFSKQYNVRLDLQLSKSGSHCDECLDENSVNYYNCLHTFIDNGVTVNQVFSHISNDKNVLSQFISLHGEECKPTLRDLQPILMSRLQSIGATREDLSIVTPTHDVEMSIC